MNMYNMVLAGHDPMLSQGALSLSLKKELQVAAMCLMISAIDKDTSWRVLQLSCNVADQVCSCGS